MLSESWCLYSVKCHFHHSVTSLWLQVDKCFCNSIRPTEWWVFYDENLCRWSHHISFRSWNLPDQQFQFITLIALDQDFQFLEQVGNCFCKVDSACHFNLGLDYLLSLVRFNEFSQFWTDLIKCNQTPALCVSINIRFLRICRTTQTFPRNVHYTCPLNDTEWFIQADLNWVKPKASWDRKNKNLRYVPTMILVNCCATI